jgi:DNA-binding transcriptional ArsR family regulator
MPSHTDAIRLRLSSGKQSSRQLAENIGVSQPTLSRALASLEDAIVRIGTGTSIQYALRDSGRGLLDIPVYRVNEAGQIRRLGILIPVRPEGFVMRHEDGVTRHSDGLPWWLLDMRPQGYLGRSFAARYDSELGLPARITEWTDTHALRALLAQGYDTVGNLLLGDVARARFLANPEPVSNLVTDGDYVRLAHEVASGEPPGSSAGGEQPKFTAVITTPQGIRHVIVKFSEAEQSIVSERWRDLLLAEHLALTTLHENGIPAAQTRIIDHGTQRFLEVERFDRIGTLGRRALFSLAALDAEFIGSGTNNWSDITRRLAADGHILASAADDASLLWAFGTLIANTDMHNGNLSFMGERRPYDLAPAYDMTPMAFAPKSGGGLPDTVSAATIHASVANETWRQAATLAQFFLAKVQANSGFSQRFQPCIAALERHIEMACTKIERLG